jgi:AraC-like DNA-binding protein
VADIQSLTADRAATRSAAAALHARLSARRARLSGEPAAMLDAAALLDAALHGAKALPATVSDDLRLDRAALGLEAGVARRDGRLLDQAGRDLRVLVESASPDYRPLTRARALALAGAGLMALARLAKDEAATAQGQALFAAAADQFTPDHSPLDWVAVQLAPGDTETPLSRLCEAESLTREPGLILGALARERRLAAETALAEALAMSPRTLARQVRAATGKSPLALVQSVRLHKARALIESTRMPIEQVAAQVGYQDATALRRLMRKAAGATPSKFRAGLFTK